MAFKKKFAPRRKFCRFCADKDLPLNYKRPDILRDFITERGKIIARRITGTCAHHQRLLTREIEEFYSNFRVSHDLIELRNLVTTADLIVRCALKRHESRGLHFSRDYPEMLPKARYTRIKKQSRRRS